MTFLLKCDCLVSPMLDHFHFASLGALPKTQDISITELRHPGVDEARSVESNFHLNLSSGFQGAHQGPGFQWISDMKNGPKMLEGPEWLVDYGGLETFQNFQDLPPVIPNSIKPSQIQLDQV